MQDDHGTRLYELDVSEYEDGDYNEWRDWKSVWAYVFRRGDVSESLYSNGGEWDDCVCIQFSGTDSCPSDRSGQELIVQKTGFLASEAGVSLSVYFQKKLGAGIFGGEGFIMQRLSGSGMAFLEFDGHVVQYDLQPGQQIVVDTGYLAAMEGSCSMEVQTVPGLKNMVFGGEGVFNTVVTGPGRVWLQTMPISNVAGEILKFMPSGK